MGTSATIARKNADGTITAIRCNYDGYVEHVGVLLARHYATPEAINGLFKLLEIRSLDETPETTEAYGRDFRTVSFYPKTYADALLLSMACKDVERQRPDYGQAVDADNEAIRKGNFNYAGIGYPGGKGKK
jgi:hypothetical protein